MKVKVFVDMGGSKFEVIERHKEEFSYNLDISKEEIREIRDEFGSGWGATGDIAVRHQLEEAIVLGIVLGDSYFPEMSSERFGSKKYINISGSEGISYGIVSYKPEPIREGCKYFVAKE